MALDQDTTGYSELTALVLPRDGIREIGRIWSGRGSLLEEGPLLDALSGAPRREDEIDWTRVALRRRARRILLQRRERELSALPRTLQQWEQHLPVTVASERSVNTIPNWRCLLDGNNLSVRLASKPIPWTGKKTHTRYGASRGTGVGITMPVRLRK